MNSFYHALRDKIKKYSKNFIENLGYEIHKKGTESFRGGLPDKTNSQAEIQSIIIFLEDVKGVHDSCHRLDSLISKRNVRGWVAPAVKNSIISLMQVKEDQVDSVLSCLNPLLFEASKLSILPLPMDVRLCEGFEIKESVVGIYEAFVLSSSNEKKAFELYKKISQGSRERDYLSIVNFINNEEAEALSLKRAAMQLISPNVIPQQHITRTSSRLNISRREAQLFGSSFKSSFINQIKVTRSLKKHLGHIPTSLLNRKTSGYKFAACFGLNSPETIADGVSLDGLKKLINSCSKPFIIKPRVGLGSKGVYAVFMDKIIRIKDQKSLSPTALFPELERWVREEGLKDSWIVQQYIEYKNAPAHDVKFYTFYGKVVLVRERRTSDGKSCWYNRDGKIVNAGIYKLFEGDLKFPTSLIEKIERISYSIPSPFMRIDLLLGDEGYYFGEFTFLTGNFHKFNSFYNQKLGEELNLANARLFSDLLNGKRFDAYENFSRKEAAM